MGKTDIAMNNFLSRADVLSDFIQQLVFKNQSEITPEMVHLLPGDESLLMKKSGNTTHKKTPGKTAHEKKDRDVLARIDQNFYCLIIGIEGQFYPSNTMPLRTMLYDAINYEKQVRDLRNRHKQNKDLSKQDYLSGISQSDRLIPVLTICFYYGEDRWNRSRDLHDMLNLQNISLPVLDMINNYKLNLIDIHDISQTDDFKTDLGCLIDLMKIRKDKTAIASYIKSHQDFLSRATDDVYDLVASLIHSDWLMKEKQKYYHLDEEVFDLCTGMKEWLADVRNEGREQGRQQGLEQTLNIIDDIRHGKSAHMIASKYQIKEKEVLMIIHRIGKIN